jgi:pentatricopeptide repeat protein
MPWIGRALRQGLQQAIGKRFVATAPARPPSQLKEGKISEYLLDRDNARKLAESMARTHAPRRAQEVLRLAHELGCPLKQNAYECVTYQLAQARHWHLIPSLVSLGVTNTGRSTVRLLNWLARAYVEMGNHASLDAVLDVFGQQNLKPNRRTFHLLIAGCVRNRDLGMAKKYLRRMEEAGFPVDSSTHTLIITLYRSLGPDFQVQVRAFDAMRDVDAPIGTAVLNSILQLRLDARDFSGARQVLSLFDQVIDFTELPLDSGENIGGNRPSSPTPSTFLPLKSALSNPKPNHVPLDATTFSILINYLLTQNEATRALKLFQQMITIGIQPDAEAIAALVRVYFAMGDEDAAMRMAARMCKGHKGASRLFSRLWSVSADRGDLQFVPPGTVLSIEVLNALMEGVLGTRGLDGSDILLHVMRARGIKPDTQTIDILITYLSQQEQACPLTLIYALKHLSSAKVPPSLRQLHTILGSVLRHEKQSVHGSGWNIPAAKFSPQREDRSVYPEDHIVNVSTTFDPTAGLEMPRSLTYRSLMDPVVGSLSSRRVRSDRATVALRIRHDAVHKSDPESAREIFYHMLARGMHPNEYHFSALMEGYAQRGEVKAAEDVLESAIKAGIIPNVVLYTILIVGYAHHGDPDSAMRIFRGMVSAGIKPDVPAIDAVASAYFVVGAYGLARWVLMNLWSYIQPFPTELRSASLIKLARAFRLLHGETRKRLTNEESLLLRQKLKELTHAWDLAGGKRRRLLAGAEQGI